MDKIKQIGFKAGEKPKRPVIQEDTSASKSYASIAYGISEGEIVGLIDGGKSVRLDGTPVISASGDINIPDVKIQERKGTNDQTHLEGFPAVVNEKQYNNIEMLQTTPFVHYINDTNLDAVGIRFTFGAIQQTNPDNGNVSGITIEYAIDVQADGEGYQEVFRTSLIGKYAAGYQRYHRIELPPADEGWEVRIRRITANSTSTYIADKMYLDAVGEILDVKMRYPNTAVIGLKFDSERFSNIPKVDFRMRGKIIRVPANYDPVTRVYASSGQGTTNGIWNGQFKMAYTTNPAWIFYDLVLNKRYGLGNRIDASMLDKWSLYSIAQYCDVLVPDGEGGLEPRFTCNVYINNRFEAYDCLMQLSGVFRGIMYWSGTAIIAGCDRPQDPVFTYTRANIIGEFNYSGTRTKDRHSVVMVSFDDPRNNYKTEKEIVSDRKAISEIGIRPKDLAAFACTSRGQAQRAGKWALFKEQIETRIVTFALGLDGYIAPVGKIIEIADPLLAGRAIGGRIAAVSADKKTITLDRDTDAKVGDRLVLNNEEGEQESRQIASVSGRKVTVAVEFDSPAAEHVWALDSDDLQLMRFTVISVSENRSQDNISFTVTALQHEPGLHEAADYSSYIDRNNYSNIDITTQKAPAEVTVSSVNRINQGIDITDLVISWKQAENAVKYHVQWRRDDGNWIQLPPQYGNQITIENIYHGVYEAKVVAINAADVNSLPTSSLPTPIHSKFAEPAILASLTATGILFGVDLHWKFPQYGAQNAAYVEIFWAFTSNKEDSKLLGAYAYPTTETTVNGLGAHQVIHFQARLVDRNGVASGFTPWVTATVTADPDKLLEMLNGHIGLEAIDKELAEKIDGAGTLAAEAQTLANQAKTTASNAQTTANNAATKAQDAANAVAKEATDRAAAIAAEAKARSDGLIKEATERATALTAQSNTLKADSASKVKALKDEVDPKLVTLQDGITKVTTDYKAGDTVIAGQLNAYKASNDNAVASVLQKAESAVSTGATNSSAITAINGQITAINNTKLDASVISGYYTKGQTDDKAAEISAGKVEEFKATLGGSGVNLLGYAMSTLMASSGTHGGAAYSVTRMLGQGVAGDDAYRIKAGSVSTGAYFYSGQNAWLAPSEPGAEFIVSLYVKSPVAKTVRIRQIGSNSNGSPGLGSAMADFNLEPDVWTRISIKYTAARHHEYIGWCIYHNIDGAAVSDDNYVLVSRPMAERAFGTMVNPSNWVEGGGVSIAVNANVDAIQTIDSEVKRVDGLVTATSSAVTALTGRLSTVEGTVSAKADASAVNSLTTRVSNAEGVNTSQGSAITSLENSVNHATTGLASKASSAALTAVDNKVTSANGRIDTTNSNVTTLTGRVSTVEGAVATKAEASALTALTTRVGNAEGVNTSQGSAITTLQNTVNHATTGLATKASTSALTATNSEVSRVNGLVTGHTNQLTQLTSDITAINGTLATKANASALNDIYTKTQTDTKAQEIAAGAVSKYSADLRVGGINLAAGYEDGKAFTGYTFQGSSIQVTARPDLKEEMVSASDPFEVASTGGTSTIKSTPQLVAYKAAIVVITFKVKNLATTALRVNFNGLSAQVTIKGGDLSSIAPDTIQEFEVTGRMRPDYDWAQFQLHSNVAGNDVKAVIADVQLEVGNKATSWKPPAYLTQQALDANATAIDNTITEVARVDGRVTTESGRITSLAGRVSTVEGGLATKADASALNSLTTRVVTEEGKSTSQGTAITSLQNAVNHSTTGLATKASSAALTIVDNKVTAVDGRVNTTNSNVATLTGRVSTVEGAVATKAEAAAVSALTTRVGTVEGGLSTQAQNTTNLTASLATTDKIAKDALPKIGGGGSFKTFKEVLNYYHSSSSSSANIVIETPITYTANMFRISGKGYNYASTKSVIDFDVSGYAYQSTGTILQHGAKNNGTFPMRIRLGMKDGKLCVILSPKGTNFAYPAFTVDATVSYGTVSDVYQTGWTGTQVTEANLAASGITNIIEPSLLDVGIELEANANAISTTNAEVSRIDGVVKSQGTQITDLSGTIAGKADASALSSLAARVTAEEGKTVSQANDITSLNTSLNKTITDLTYTDTRNDNQPPQWYRTNYPRKTTKEFKLQTAIGASTFFSGTFCLLDTDVGWPSAAAGAAVIQTATSSDDPSLYIQRRSTGSIPNETWTAWSQPIKDIRDDLGTKASASALNSLTTEVSRVNGVATSTANQLTSLSSTVGKNTTDIQTQTTTTNGILAKHTVKINNNGFVTGYGLISTANNGAVVSAFKVDADAFAVGKSGSGILPFVVTTAGQTINGIKYPAAGTWINSAYIANATIGTAHISDLAVTTAKIGDLQVDTLKIKDNAVTVPYSVEYATDINTSGDFTSSTYVTDALISEWEARHGAVAAMSIVRSGGKLRIDCGFNILSEVYALPPTGDGTPDKSKLRMFVSVYVNGSLAKRYRYVANTPGLTTWPASYRAGFDYALILPPIILPAATGSTNVEIKLGFAGIDNSIRVLQRQGGNGPMITNITNRTLVLMELKK